MPTLHVRFMTKQDIPEVSAFLDGTPERDLWDYIRFEKCVVAPSVQAIVGESVTGYRGKRRVDSVLIYRPAGRYVNIRLIAVRKTVRNSGMGGALFDHCVGALAGPRDAVTCVVHECNLAALKFLRAVSGRHKNLKSHSANVAGLYGDRDGVRFYWKEIKSDQKVGHPEQRAGDQRQPGDGVY